MCIFSCNIPNQPRSQCFSPPRRGWAAEKSPRNEVDIKHKEKCFIRCPNTEKWVEKNEAQPSFFLTNFEVFGYLMKHSFEGLMWLLKVLIILREIQSKNSPNFMIIRIT